MSINIITHRGLDPDIPGFPMESSIEAFTRHIERGYGLEFDVRFTRDNKMVVIHDDNLKRLTEGRDVRAIDFLTLDEILTVDFKGNHLSSFEGVISLIKEKQAPGKISALHIKSGMQNEFMMTAIMETLVKNCIDPEKFIIFDLRVDSGKFIKLRWPQFQLSASLSHPYDCKRFNKAVGHTLLTLDKLIANKDIFSWAWGDEWDLKDEGGKTKKLYTKEIFSTLRRNNFKIALVTTELHGTTPGLLGGEEHEDGIDPIRIETRYKEIITLSPDAVCTDHPDLLRSHIEDIYPQ